MGAIPYAAATFALIIHWAVGMAISVAVADTEIGLIRDHPVFGRRLSGRFVPPMIVVGLLAPVLVGIGARSMPPIWMTLSVPLMLPFAAISWRWSRTWIGRSPAWKRRKLGIWSVAAGALGVVPSIFLAMNQLEPEWLGAIPLSIFTAGVALPGALTYLTLMAVTAGLPVEVPAGKVQHIAEMAGVGLLLSLLVLGDVGFAWLESRGDWPPGARSLVLGWVVCAVAIPGIILLVRARWWKMPDHIFMPAALCFALAGMWMAYLLVFRFPGLIGPVQWE